VAFEELDPPYATLVVDPPWQHDEGSPVNAWGRTGDDRKRVKLRYSSMSVSAIAAMDVESLAAPDAHLYLWTTNRFLRQSFDVAEAWGFRPVQTLVWCKPPVGIGPGGAFANTTEFVLFCRRGTLRSQERVESTWWEWSRSGHSTKPAAFADLVERVSPGPYVELFARAPRLGWDSWGKGYEVAAS
jgi:N6-adenosine-specific RNA methylase IME4